MYEVCDVHAHASTSRTTAVQTVHKIEPNKTTKNTMPPVLERSDDFPNLSCSSVSQQKVTTDMSGYHN